MLSARLPRGGACAISPEPMREKRPRENVDQEGR